MLKVPFLLISDFWKIHSRAFNIMFVRNPRFAVPPSGGARPPEGETTNCVRDNLFVELHIL